MPVPGLSIACHRAEYVLGLTTHSPAASMALVTLGSYSQVWMLRPPCALLTTVTSEVNSASNSRPQPIGHAPLAEPFATVESPASHTLIGAAAATRSEPEPAVEDAAELAAVLQVAVDPPAPAAAL